jgi:hypothetical protein
MRDDDRAVEDGETQGGVSDDTAADNDLVTPYGERDDEEDFVDAEPEAAAEAAAAEPEKEAATALPFVAPVFNNFMDVLYPAKPPATKNARIIRRFDLEAAKHDPRPNTGPAPVPAPEPAPAPKKEPTLSREEARALRNRSLRAAAGLG